MLASGEGIFFFLSHLGAKGTLPTEGKGRTASGFVSCCVNTLLHTSNPQAKQANHELRKIPCVSFPKSFDSCPLSYRNDLKRKAKSQSMQMTLEKQFHNQLAGVGGALERSGATQGWTQTVAPWASAS